MRPFLAIVQKELLERRLILVAALIVGLMPLIAASTVTWRGVTSAEIRDSSALMIVALFAVGTALAVGSSLVCRELAEGRLSFYYARPVGGWTLWGGKLSAALVLLAAAILLAWLPSLVAGSRPWELLAWETPEVPLSKPFPWEIDLHPYLGDWALLQKLTIGVEAAQATWWGTAALLLLLVSLSHAAAVFARVRSAWMLFDFAMLVTLAGLLTATAARLTAHGALYGLWSGARIVLVTLVLASLAAPGVQLALGRSRPSRAHGVYSLALWLPLALVSLGLLAHAHLATRAAPDDLVEVLDFKAAPRGPWAFVGGAASPRTGYLPAFAVHVEDGRSLPLDPLTFLDRAPVFSDDCRVLAWSRCADVFCEVRWLDLEGLAEPRDQPAAAATALTFQRSRLGSYFGAGELMILSSDGRRLALLQGQQVAVYRLATGSLLATARLPSRDLLDVELRFLTDDLLRVTFRTWSHPDFSLETWELDVPSQRWRQTDAMPAWQYQSSPEGDRSVVRWKLDEPVKVLDGSGENELYELDYRPSAYPVRFRFLSAGRTAVVQGSGTHPVRLQLFSPQGAELHRFDFDSDLVVLGGEPVAGQLLVGVRKLDAGVPGTTVGGLGKRLRTDPGGSETRLLDLDTGRTLRTFPGLMPGTRPSLPGSPAAKILFGDRGAPFRLDVDRGAVEPLLRLAG